MRNRVILASFWCLCGLYTFGTLTADLDYYVRHGWQGRSNNPRRDNLWVAAGFAATGPLGVVGAAWATHFNRHGWELRDNRKQD
jgi:hypothetical protein